jgi:hypothetical protein
MPARDACHDHIWKRGAVQRADRDIPEQDATGRGLDVAVDDQDQGGNGVALRNGAPQTRVPEAAEGLTGGWRARWRGLAASPLARHLVLLACYLAAGVAVTWPRATWLVEGKLQTTRDAGTYVWDFWWIAHCVEHLSNPWFTRAIVAPVGVQLGYHALMPLAGVVMLPVTVLFGPSASYNLLSILMPGLLCYAMYRAARLWLPSQTGAIAAGGFFGLSSIMAWHAWYQLNLAAGALFLPLALEAAVRLRRNPSRKQAVILGVIAGASLLTDQESAVLVAILIAVTLLPWLAGPLARWARALPWLPSRLAPADGEAGATAGPGGLRRLAVSGLAAAVALVVAGPQIAAMMAQSHAGGATFPAGAVDTDYALSGANLAGMFAVSSHATRLGLTVLKPIAYGGPVLDGVLTFGFAVSVLALAGLAVSRRRRSAWLLAALWLGTAALALGSVLRIGDLSYTPLAVVWHGVRLSAIMPYTWFVKLPGMAGFREAARLTMLGILPASLLAGAAVDWLRYHLAPLLIPVLVFAALEAGWAGNPGLGTMPTAMPRVDGPIAADHSNSIVVDIPFGVRGGVPLPGEGAAFDPESQVLATADGHPRAVGYLSRLPVPTLAAVRRHPFYAGLLTAQGQPLPESEALTGTSSDTALIAAARQDAHRMGIGWAIVWRQTPGILRYLARTGFRFDYSVGAVLVYRAPAGPAARPAG